MVFKSGSGLRNFLQHQREPSSLSQIVPFGLSIFFMLLQQVPVPGFMGVPVMPFFVLIIIFFWSVAGENRLGPIAVFSLGLLQDLLAATPLGLWAVTFLLMHLYVASQSTVLVSGSFITNWVSFGVVSFMTYAFVYFGVSWQSGHLYSFSVILLPYVTTLASFPFMARFLVFFEERLARIGIGS